MRTKLALLVVCVTTLLLRAEEAVMVEARILEAPPRLNVTKADCEKPAGQQKRALHILSAPRLVTPSGVPARLFVGQSIPVRMVGEPALTNLQVGIELRLLSTVEGDLVRYALSTVVTRREHLDMTPGRETAELSAWEHHSSGICKSGESVLLSSRGAQEDRKLYVYLTFRKSPAR
jgi:hypothetical protein